MCDKVPFFLFFRLRVWIDQRWISCSEPTAMVIMVARLVRIFKTLLPKTDWLSHNPYARECSIIGSGIPSPSKANGGPISNEFQSAGPGKTAF